MTQEDLQRDVAMLERVLADGRVYPEEAEALDRAIETARILASLTGYQRAYLVECCAIAEASAIALGSSATLGDAHRKVARLIGGVT